MGASQSKIHSLPFELLCTVAKKKKKKKKSVGFLGDGCFLWLEQVKTTKTTTQLHYISNQVYVMKANWMCALGMKVNQSYWQQQIFWV